MCYRRPHIPQQSLQNYPRFVVYVLTVIKMYFIYYLNNNNSMFCIMKKLC